jgi:peptidoglycan/LPS O-acetylase OafA/YrhL
MTTTTTSSGPAGNSHFVALDGVRGLAAVAVMIYHHNSPLPAFAAAGYLAVDLFFVMSGAVISRAYDRRFAQGLGWKAFTLRRFLRFLPMNVLGVALGYLFHRFFTDEPVCGTPLNDLNFELSALLGTLMVPWPQKNTCAFPLNVVTWSLAFELWVNAFYAFVAPRLTAARLWAIIGLSGVALAACIAQIGNADVGWTIDPVEGPYAVARTVFSFFVGVWIQRTRPDVLISLPVLLALVTTCFIVPGDGRLMQLRDGLAVFVVFPVAVAGLLNANVTGWGVRLCRFMGDASFPLYAVHIPLTKFAAVADSALGLPKLTTFTLAMPVVVLMAVALERHVDRPARTWIAAWADRWAPIRATPSA